MKKLELLQKPNVNGVFFVIVTQTYATLNDLLPHHKHLLYTPSCLLRQFSNVKLLREISSQRLCKVTRMSLINQRVNCMQVFHLEVEEGSLIQLNAAVYGLVNTPSAWRKTIMRGIKNLSYRRSCYNPCIFCLKSESGPQGHILIKVDDLAKHGSVVHAKNIVKLQKTFKFGKWKSINDSEGDYASRTVIQDKSYGFHIHEAKFVRVCDFLQL